jgi:hypothetical protein
VRRQLALMIKLHKKLKLPVINKVKMSSATHEAIDANVYPALISFTGIPIKINALTAIGANLVGQDLIALFMQNTP